VHSERDKRRAVHSVIHVLASLLLVMNCSIPDPFLKYWIELIEQGAFNKLHFRKLNILRLEKYGEYNGLQEMVARLRENIKGNRFETTEMAESIWIVSFTGRRGKCQSRT
jgi:hypothetical protein